MSENQKVGTVVLAICLAVFGVCWLSLAMQRKENEKLAAQAQYKRECEALGGVVGRKHVGNYWSSKYHRYYGRYVTACIQAPAGK